MRLESESLVQSPDCFMSMSIVAERIKSLRYSNIMVILLHACVEDIAPACCSPAPYLISTKRKGLSTVSNYLSAAVSTLYEFVLRYNAQSLVLIESPAN